MNLRVLKGSSLAFAMPDGTTITWQAISDTDTSNIIDVVARFETMADERPKQSDGES